MSSSYMPGSDPLFDAWLSQFASYSAGHAAELGLTADDLAALNTSQIQWSTDFVALNAAHVAWKSAVASKRDSRQAVQDLVRQLVARIQVNPTTTDADREGLGIPLRDVLPSSPELPQDERPTAHIDITAPLEHVVLIRTKTPTGERRGKPAGAIGCEIFRKIGDAPAGPPDTEFVTLTTTSKVKLQYDYTDGGKKAHYLMRYVTRTGEKGPWSELESATIAA